jgi:LCP family protein required for cell wall assembly
MSRLRLELPAGQPDPRAPPGGRVRDIDRTHTPADPDPPPGPPDAHPPDRQGAFRIGVRILAGLLAAVFLWGIWSLVGVWFSFRSIDTISVDLDEARQAIEALPPEDRPAPPPLEPEDDSDPEPVAIATTNAADEPTAATAPPVVTVPPGITGEQIPYDPAFITSPAIPDETFDAFLIIGSDFRETKRSVRADVIILALVPDDGSPPILVSIPRDLWVDIPCWNEPNRINASLNGCGDAASGPELLALTVADFTGIQPDHFALFNFEDFTRVIDAFGGVEICVENAVREKRLELPAGCSIADGAMALLWIRSRRTEEYVDGQWQRMSGVNDITRNQRQQELLLEILRRVRSLDSLTSLVDIVDSVADAVIIDDDITLGSAIALAWDLREFAPSEIRRLIVPFRYHRTESGAQVLIAREQFSDVLATLWPATG